MFEKSLQDLVKGIRANKKNESQYIAGAIVEIKKELANTDPFVKAQAVRKCTYLQMMGYDMSWCCFAVVEVLSQPRFAHKRIGSLAASQMFTQTTDVVLLVTNMLKNEFKAKSPYEVGLAITCLSNIATPDLSRDLLSDLCTMMQSSRPYVRKKAVLCLFKCYLRYPQGLRLTFERLKEKLDDPDTSVVSCAVNVVCELANKKPKNYLSLAPAFFKLLTTSNNNWMLIKVVKLMSSLVTEEPRLARKLLEPLATIIQNTPAKSLQYECIYTVTKCLPHTKKPDGSDARNVPAVVRLCNDQLRLFVNDADQNLKYLGLVGLLQLMESHPRVVAEHRDVVLSCLADEDVTIRRCSLELIGGMITQRNLMDMVRRLLEQVRSAEGAYREQLIDKIMFICSRDRYSFLTDFAWYISVLVDLAHVECNADNNHGVKVAAQLLDVTARVPDLRAHAVASMIPLLLDAKLLEGQCRFTMSEVLYAAAWIVGEYAALIKRDDAEGSDSDEEVAVHTPSGVLAALMDPRASNLPAHVQAVFVQAMLKVYAFVVKEEPAQMLPMASKMVGRYGALTRSPHVEIQERAASLRQVLLTLGLGTDTLPEGERPADALSAPQPEAAFVGAVLATLVEDGVGPVSTKAQRKVPVPDGLDLKKGINKGEMKMLSETTEAVATALTGKQAPVSFLSLAGGPEVGGGTDVGLGGLGGDDGDESDYSDDEGSKKKSKKGRKTHEEAEKARLAEEKRRATDPFYIRPADIDVSGIPIEKLEDGELGKVKGKKGKKDKKKKVKVIRMTVVDDDDMPDGALSSGDDMPAKKEVKKNPHDIDLGDVDITQPLGAEEKLPELQHHVVPELAIEGKKDKKSKKDKKGKKEKDDKGGKKDKKDKKGKGEKESKKDKKSGKGGAAPAADLIDFGAFDMPGAAAAPAPVAAAPAPMAVLADTEPAVEEKKSKKSKKDKKESKDKGGKDKKEKGKKSKKPKCLKSAAAFAPKPTTLAEFGGMMQNPGLKWYSGAARCVSLALPAFVARPLARFSLARVLVTCRLTPFSCSRVRAPRLPTEAVDMAGVAAALSASLNAHIVDTQAGSTSLYTSTPEGVHLAVLAKLAGLEVSIQMKCTDKSLTKKLAAELEAKGSM